MDLRRLARRRRSGSSPTDGARHAPSSSTDPASAGTARARSSVRRGRRPGRWAVRSATATTTTRCWSRRARQLDAYFAGRPQGVRPAPAARGHRLPAARSGTSCSAIAWGDDRDVRRDRAAARDDRARLPRGRAGQRPQPDPDRHPVPPGGRRRRHAHRLRRGVERKQLLLDLERKHLSGSRMPRPPCSERRGQDRPRHRRRDVQGPSEALLGYSARGAATRRAARRRRARRGRASGRAGGRAARAGRTPTPRR